MCACDGRFCIKISRKSQKRGMKWKSAEIPLYA
uniref:RstR-4b n=1 Tax=Affertcholeramvirus CTXphi TaxID=141904 RepID=Q9MBU9_9VIRU|nr:rstR-4b [Vibrio phage CTXphi]